jgi:hypothetical protein
MRIFKWHKTWVAQCVIMPTNSVRISKCVAFEKGYIYFPTGMPLEKHFAKHATAHAETIAAGAHALGRNMQEEAKSIDWQQIKETADSAAGSMKEMNWQKVQDTASSAASSIKKMDWQKVQDAASSAAGSIADGIQATVSDANNAMRQEENERATGTRSSTPALRHGKAIVVNGAGLPTWVIKVHTFV